MTSPGLSVQAVNSHLLCVLCGGYLVDATTVTECLHSFCRTCIVRYLEASSYCPVCDTQVHSSKPHLGIQPDHTLQALVYKIVPQLFTKEAKRRIDFQLQTPVSTNSDVTSCVISGTSRDHRLSDDKVSSSETLEQTIYREMTQGELFYTEDEQISLCLEYTSSRNPSQDVHEISRDSNNNMNETIVSQDRNKKKLPLDQRFLLCPAGVTVGILKKFIRNKFELPMFYHIDLIHTKDVLQENFKLLDIAYIYTWRRTAPLRLYYSVYETKPKVSIPVHIRLPTSMRTRHLTCTSTTTSSSTSRSWTPEFRIRSKLSPVQDPHSQEDSKADIADQIRNFASRRSRAFKLRAHAHVRSNAANQKYRTYCYHNNHVLSAQRRTAVQVKKEAVSDDSVKTSKPTLPSSGSLKVRIPRYMIRGYPFTIKRKSRSPSTSECSSSTNSEHRESSPDSDRSDRSYGSHHYDFDEDDARPLVPKIIRRRLSDSSWSSAI